MLVLELFGTLPGSIGIIWCVLVDVPAANFPFGRLLGHDNEFAMLSFSINQASVIFWFSWAASLVTHRTDGNHFVVRANRPC